MSSSVFEVSAKEEYCWMQLPLTPGLLGLHHEADPWMIWLPRVGHGISGAPAALPQGACPQDRQLRIWTQSVARNGDNNTKMNNSSYPIEACPIYQSLSQAQPMWDLIQSPQTTQADVTIPHFTEEKTEALKPGNWSEAM